MMFLPLPQAEGTQNVSKLRRNCGILDRKEVMLGDRPKVRSALEDYQRRTKSTGFNYAFDTKLNSVNFASSSHSHTSIPKKEDLEDRPYEISNAHNSVKLLRKTRPKSNYSA